MMDSNFGQGPGTKREQIRVSVAYPQAQFIVKLSEETGLSLGDVAGLILNAALKPLVIRGKGLRLPLNFKLDDSPEAKPPAPQRTQENHASS
jgi:hypothetical protein